MENAVAPAGQRVRLRLTEVSGYGWGVAAITGLTLVSRFYALGSLPRLWGDEAFTGVAVRHSLLQMLDVVRHDNHPPLEYLLLHLVAQFSTSPFALRLVSAGAGTAMVPIAAALGRRTAGDWAGLLAGAAVATFPAFLLYSRDTRMYALATMFVLASALGLWRAIEQPSRRRQVVYGALVAASVYSHYFSVIAIAIQLLVALAVLRPRRDHASRLVLACAVGGMTLLPWLVAALPQFQHIGQPFWLPKVTPASLAASVSQFPSQSLTDQLAVGVEWAAAVAGLTLIAIFWRRAAPRERRGVAFLLLAAIVPTIALVVVSFWKPLYDPRFAGIFWGTGLVVVGVSLSVFRRFVAVALLMVLALAAAVSLLRVHNPDYDLLLAPVASSLRRDDVVVTNGPTHYFSAAYALGPQRVGSIRVVAGDIPWFFGVAGYAPGTHVREVPYVTGRVFLVTDIGQSPPSMPAGFMRASSSCQVDVCVDTYSR